MRKGIEMDYNNYNNNTNYNNSNNDNYYIDNTASVYTNIPGQFYNQPPKAPKMGLAIAAMIIGILSMTLCCAGGTFLGLAGLIMGIVSLVKNYDGKGMAIAGIVTSLIGILVGIFMLFYIFIFAYAFNEGMEQYEEYEDYYDYSDNYDYYDYYDYSDDYDYYDYSDDYDWSSLYDANAFSGHTFAAQDYIVYVLPEYALFTICK